ncbi:hypothetical protein Agub_g14380, partial [Astrephomene gubernaculifera]
SMSAAGGGLAAAAAVPHALQSPQQQHLGGRKGGAGGSMSGLSEVRVPDETEMDWQPESHKHSHTKGSSGLHVPSLEPVELWAAICAAEDAVAPEVPGSKALQAGEEKALIFTRLLLSLDIVKEGSPWPPRAKCSVPTGHSTCSALAQGMVRGDLATTGPSSSSAPASSYTSPLHL